MSTHLDSAQRHRQARPRPALGDSTDEGGWHSQITGCDEQDTAQTRQQEEHGEADQEEVDEVQQTAKRE